MSREIKFDLIYKGETGFHHKKYYLEGLMCGIDKICDIHSFMDLVSIRQCTGLKDAYGVEIYEGDILKINNNNYQVFIGGYFSENSAGFGVHYCINGDTSRYCKQASPFDVQPDAEVIGNIHENPELLDYNEED